MDLKEFIEIINFPPVTFVLGLIAGAAFGWTAVIIISTLFIILYALSYFLT